MRVTIAIPDSHPASIESAKQQTYANRQILAGDLKNIEGEALLVLRRGDQIKPDALSKLVPYLTHNQGVSFAYAALKPQPETPTYEDGPAFLHQYFKGNRRPYGGSLLMRTQLFTQLDGFPGYYQQSGDRALWLRLALQGWVGYCPEKLVEVAPVECSASLDGLLHEEYLAMAEAMADLGRYRCLPHRMEGMNRLGCQRIRTVLIDQIQQAPKQQRWSLIRRYNRYWQLRHLPALARLLTR
jgi:hypothetical protein